MKLSGLSFALMLLISLNSIAQESTPTLSLDNSPIEDQFKYVYQQSNDYEEFKMIKRWQFQRLKTHVMDTLSVLDNQLEATQQLVLNREASIDSLLQLNASVNSNLEKIKIEKDSISFFGMLLQKNTYNSILWTIISLLLAGLVLFILLFKRSNSVTLQNKHDLKSVQDEFEAFRKRALEREEGVVRKYHDELMKYKTKVK